MIVKENQLLKNILFSGLDIKFILNNNLDVPSNFLERASKNKGGYTIGRLDSDTEVLIRKWQDRHLKII